MLRCREVARLIASEQARQSGPWRRLMIRLHLSMCLHCRRYARQIRRLGETAREIWGSAGADRDALGRIEDAVKETLARRSDPGDPGR